MERIRPSVGPGTGNRGVFQQAGLLSEPRAVICGGTRVISGVGVPAISGRTAGAAFVISLAILLRVFWRHPALRIGWATCGVVRGRGRAGAIDRWVE